MEKVKGPHPEERLLLHVLRVALAGAQPPLRVPAQQLGARWNRVSCGLGPSVPLFPAQPSPSAHPAHDADSLSGQEAGVPHLVIDDTVEHLLLVVPRERGLRTAGRNVVSAGPKGRRPFLPGSRGHSPHPRASRRAARPAPTSPRHACRTCRSAPRGPGTRGSRRTCWSDRRTPCLQAAGGTVGTHGAGAVGTPGAPRFPLPSPPQAIGSPDPALTLLAEAEVRNLHVALGVQQQIVQL